MEVVELLVEEGADIHATLNCENTTHGICEVAAIRGDIKLLSYLYNRLTDVCTRVRNLMVIKYQIDIYMS